MIVDRWMRRLENWALWSVSGARTSISSAYDGTWGDGAPRLPPPLVGEALDTDTLLHKLPKHEQDTIVAKFVWTVPETIGERATQLGIHPNTFNARLKAAAYRLEDLQEARRRGLPQHHQVSSPPA